jgi:hypothetical protein
VSVNQGEIMKKKLNSCLAIIVTFLGACACAFGTPLSGAVTGVLTQAGSPYLVMGNLVLPAGQQLTIQQGVTLDFQGNYYFEVDGTIDVSGTATNPVLFTADNHANGWGGFRIVGNWNSNIFDNAIFEYGRALTPYSPPYHGPSMEGAGMYVEDGCVTVAGCVFRYNHSTTHGSAISTFGCADILVENSVFTWNASVGGCGGLGAINFGNSSPTNVNLMKISLLGCVIAYNTACDDGGGVFAAGTSASDGNIFIANNLIYSNTCTGVWAPESAAAGVFIGCRVVNNVFCGNVVAANAAPTKSQVVLNGCDFRNNIVWGGTGQAVVFDVSGSPTIQYNCVQGGYAGTGNISSDPMFVNASANNFSLDAGSPCVDAGTTNGLTLSATDFLGNPRIAGEVDPILWTTKRRN